MSNAVIVSACRTPGGKYGGGLAGLKATDLGALAIRESLRRAGVSDDVVDEVVMGNGWQAGVGANPARIATYRSRLPVSVPAYTVNKRCGSGLKAIMNAADRVRLGDIDLSVAGGMESASNVPYLLEEARWGHRMGDKKTYDALHRDGLMCPLAEMMMGATAEILAEEHDISREEQDAFGLRSHQRALEAIDSGAFAEETFPVTVTLRKKGEVTIDTDEIPRRNTSMEKLGRLPVLFKENGTVTAGTSSALCDAGSAVTVTSPEWAKGNGLEPIAEILAYDSGATEPDHMGMGPTVAVPKALERAGLSLEDIDLIELNEAFAAQVLAVHRDMPFDMDRCNVHGGAIALGHPIGATGAKILTTLYYALKHSDRELGLATACIGGGQGVAMVIRRLV
ncbi:MAG: thiolase family protein [Synergistales bacterium]|nr:thiolase family protein [Synergistales bacterium]